MPRIPIDNAAKTTLATIPDTREDNNTKLSVRKDNVLVSKQSALSRFFTLRNTVINNNQRIVDNFAESIFRETGNLNATQKDEFKTRWKHDVEHSGKHRITAGTLRAMQADATQADAAQFGKAETVTKKILDILNDEAVNQQNLDVELAKQKIEMDELDVELNKIIGNPDDEPDNQQNLDVQRDHRIDYSEKKEQLEKMQHQQREAIILCMMDAVHAEGRITMEPLNLITKHFSAVLGEAKNEMLNQLFPDIEKDLKGTVIQRHNTVTLLARQQLQDALQGIMCKHADNKVKNITDPENVQRILIELLQNNRVMNADIRDYSLILDRLENNTTGFIIGQLPDHAKFLDLRHSKLPQTIATALKQIVKDTPHIPEKMQLSQDVMDKFIKLSALCNALHKPVPPADQLKDGAAITDKAKADFVANNIETSFSNSQGFSVINRILEEFHPGINLETLRQEAMAGWLKRNLDSEIPPTFLRENSSFFQETLLKMEYRQSINTSGMVDFANELLNPNAKSITLNKEIRENAANLIHETKWKNEKTEKTANEVIALLHESENWNMHKASRVISMVRTLVHDKDNILSQGKEDKEILAICNAIRDAAYDAMRPILFDFIRSDKGHAVRSAMRQGVALLQTYVAKPFNDAFQQANVAFVQATTEAVVEETKAEEGAVKARIAKFKAAKAEVAKAEVAKAEAEKADATAVAKAEAKAAEAKAKVAEAEVKAVTELWNKNKEGNLLYSAIAIIPLTGIAPVLANVSMTYDIFAGKTHLDSDAAIKKTVMDFSSFVQADAAQSIRTGGAWIEVLNEIVAVDNDDRAAVENDATWNAVFPPAQAQEALTQFAQAQEALEIAREALTNAQKELDELTQPQAQKLL